MWKTLIEKITEDLKEWNIDLKDYDVKLIDGSQLGLRIEINNMHFAYVEEKYWDDAAAYILARTIKVFANDLNDEESILRRG